MMQVLRHPTAVIKCQLIDTGVVQEYLSGSEIVIQSSGDYRMPRLADGDTLFRTVIIGLKACLQANALIVAK